MKTRTAIFFVALAAVIQMGISGEPAKKFPTLEVKIDYAKKNWRMALHSGNDGVVEGVLRCVAQLKMSYPSVDVAEFQQAFEQLSLKHPNGQIRYKAYLSASICAHPEWFSTDTALSVADEENFFYAASERLQQQTLTTEHL